MSDSVNPYQSPENASVPEERFTTQGGLTETMLLYLKGAAPWLKFLGILGFIGAAFMVLVGVVYIIIFLNISNISTFVDHELLYPFVQMAFGGQILALLLIAGVFTFIPALFTYRYGSKVHRYLKSGSNADLEAAFKNNKALWKFWGISSIVYLALGPITVIITVISAFSSFWF